MKRNAQNHRSKLFHDAKIEFNRRTPTQLVASQYFYYAIRTSLVSIKSMLRPCHTLLAHKYTLDIFKLNMLIRNMVEQFY